MFLACLPAAATRPSPIIPQRSTSLTSTDFKREIFFFSFFRIFEDDSIDFDLRWGNFFRKVVTVEIEFRIFKLIGINWKIFGKQKTSNPFISYRIIDDKG